MNLRSLVHRASVPVASGVMLALFLVASSLVLAQQVAIRSFDCSQYPRIRTTLCAFDGLGRPVMLDSTRDRKVFDNDTRQTLGMMSFTSAPAPRSASVCLMFDTGSDSLQAAALASLGSIDSAVLAPHVLSLAAFGSLPYIVRDVRSADPSVRSFVNRLPRLYGHDPDAALADSLCGALHLVRRDTLAGARRMRAVILISGSQHGVRTDSIRALLEASGAELYVITVGALAPPTLRSCVHASGGLYLDSVPMNAIARSINACLHAIRGMACSVLEWNADASSCDNMRRARFDIRSLSTSAEYSFSLPDSVLRLCALLPRWQRFAAVAVNDSVDIPVRITAGGSDISVVDISSDNPLFRILNAPIGVTVSRSSPALCTLRFTARDTLEQHVTLRVVTGACDTAMASFHVDGSASSAVRPRIMSRLGNLVLRPRSSFTLRWSGVPADDSLQWLLSSDGGVSWIPQDVVTSTFSAVWTLPQLTSNSCVLMVRSLKRGISDTSDSFSVAASPVSISPISFDTVRVDEYAERTFMNCIRNTTASPLLIDSIRAVYGRIDVLRGEQVSVFPGDASHLRLQLLPRRSLQDGGVEADTLQVWCRNDYLRIPVRYVVRDRALRTPATIDMGGVGIGGSQDSTVIDAVRLHLTDSSATVADISLDVPDTAVFRISRPALPYLLRSSTPLLALRATFLADAEARHSAGIIVRTNEGSSRIRIVAEGVCAAPSSQTSIRLPDSLTVSIAATTSIPIRYAPLPRGYALRERPWQMTVRVPESILVPTGSTPSGERDRGDRRMVLSGRGALRGDTLAMPEFVTALGRSHEAVVLVESFRWTDDCGGSIGPQSALLHVRNACTAGGERAFLDGDSLHVRSIAPNPADGEAQVRYVLREENDTRIELVDVYGRVLFRTEPSLMSRGEHELTVPTASLSEGTYYLVVITPSGSGSSVLKVMR